MSVDTMDNIMSKEHKTSLRKSNKPVMEKRRRARINNCLTQLKSLVLESMRKDSSQYSKLEKADILEMTVKHLRNLQRNQLASAIASDPTVVTKFRAGFHECANEVIRYLGTVQNVGTDVKSRLISHLSSCIQSQNTTSTENVPTQIPSRQSQQQVSVTSPQPHHINILQPLSVHIPQNANLTSRPQSSEFSYNRQSSPQSQNQSPQLLNIATPVLSTECNNNSPIKTGQISGQFQIIPNNLYNGPVAVYVGQINQRQCVTSSDTLPVFTLQVPASNTSPSFPVTSSPTDFQQKSKPFAQPHRSAFVECKQGIPEASDSLWRPW
ncbi:transcription factor HES-1-A-like [Saccostrea echinata]|uniref:transcription factor HES-1-A-like n=1 Tax=Saccostrea echinata TaxID=191078 RepID=UPI002A7FA415|nr:transcription factor HES-1-A-like [Saccostrea echinata]